MSGRKKLNENFFFLVLALILCSSITSYYCLYLQWRNCAKDLDISRPASKAVLNAEEMDEILRRGKQASKYGAVLLIVPFAGIGLYLLATSYLDPYESRVESILGGFLMTMAILATLRLVRMNLAIEGLYKHRQEEQESSLNPRQPANYYRLAWGDNPTQY